MINQLSVFSWDLSDYIILFAPLVTFKLQKRLEKKLKNEPSDLL